MHVRQTDSLLVEDYRAYEGRDSKERLFLPIEETRHLLGAVRELSPVPVLIGGHGFSSNPRGLFDYLKPDLAVVGEPDGLFSRFDDVLAGRDLESVPNLVYWKNGRPVLNARTFFPPASGAEYTVEIVEGIKRFYGERFLDGQTFPVEVMRGCPYRCYFCVEPVVKGHEARLRNLDAVMADVEFLAWHGLNRIWLVCSELNVFGPELALDVGERMIELQEKLGETLRWYAFSLPVRMREETWRTLVRSGFRGGFNTFMSLDDVNLKKGRVPHRGIDAVEEYEIIERLAVEMGADADDFRSRGTLALFFGNAFATLETVSRSLALLRARGLLETARVPVVISATRVFEGTEQNGGADRSVAWSFDANGPTAPDPGRLPTFSYPKALLDHFGDRRALDVFFTWVQTTLLSRAHEADKDWPLFLANTVPQAQTVRWLSERLRSGAGGASDSIGRRLGTAARAELTALLLDPKASAVAELYFPSRERRVAAGEVAYGVLLSLFEHASLATASALRRLGFPESLDASLDAPVYDLLEPLYRRFESLESAVAAEGPASIEGVVARFIVYRRNLVVDPKYRPALFTDEATGLASESRHKVRLELAS